MVLGACLGLSFSVCESSYFSIFQMWHFRIPALFSRKNEKIHLCHVNASLLLWEQETSNHKASGDLPCLFCHITVAKYMRLYQKVHAVGGLILQLAYRLLSFTFKYKL